jgi:phosphomannomutase
MGGTYLFERVGNIYLKARMEEDSQIIFGGEHSGHYFFPGIKNIDSGLIAFITFLECMSKYHLSAKEIREKFSKYATMKEISLKVSSVSDAIKCVAAEYTDGAQSRFDGLKVVYPNWWLSLRGGLNEPVIRLNIEAEDPVTLETHKQKILKLIAAYVI